MTPDPAFRELDTVVLVRDLPDSGLGAGDLGAVVQVYSPEALEVEWPNGSLEPTGRPTPLPRPKLRPGRSQLTSSVRRAANRATTEYLDGREQDQAH
jgi:hypothetical protein